MFEDHPVLDRPGDMVDVAAAGPVLVGFDEDGLVVEGEAGFAEAVDLVGHGILDGGVMMDGWLCWMRGGIEVSLK